MNFAERPMKSRSDSPSRKLLFRSSVGIGIVAVFSAIVLRSVVALLFHDARRRRFVYQIVSSSPNIVFLAIISLMYYARRASKRAPVLEDYEKRLSWTVSLLGWILNSRWLTKELRRVKYPFATRKSSMDHADSSNDKSLVPLIVQRDRSVTMRDGIRLRHTHVYLSGTHNGARPVVLIRTPYGRGRFLLTAREFIEQLGVHVVLQDCRGRSDSAQNDLEYEEAFLPLTFEEQDGVDTLEWIANQPFCNGRVGMYGVSYVGLALYAVVDYAATKPIVHPGTGRPLLCALVPINAASNIFSIVFPSSAHRRAEELLDADESNEHILEDSDELTGPLHLELLALWGYIVMCVQDPRASLLQRLWRRINQNSRMNKAYRSAPISNIDQQIAGNEMSSWRQPLLHRQPSHGYWRTELKAQLCRLSNCPPTHIVAGWHDFFLRQSLQDFALLQQHGDNKHFLTIGPWTHWDILTWGPIGRDIAIEWFGRHLSNAAESISHRHRTLPVRLYVAHGCWLDLESFPPRADDPRASIQRLRLCSGGALQLETEPQISAPIRQLREFQQFIYDPACDPTPAIGGASFDMRNCGSKDQRIFESRLDVLTFTSPVLETQTTVLGMVTAHLTVSSSVPYTDFVVRLCDVHPDGRSLNVCDGVCRITPVAALHPDVSGVRPIEGDGASDEVNRAGLWSIHVDVWATGHIFEVGHKIRVQVASGAHPRWARNSGKGADTCIHGQLDEFVPAIQRVYLDPGASMIQLPIYKV